MCETNSENAQVFQSALSLLTVKTMQLAKYICTNDVEDRYDYRHYALAVPLYTHFTSPIRRYADLVVHRQVFIFLNLYRNLIEACCCDWMG